ncbi:universal stress protein [Amycolatopsis magusensis]|uniref:Nucleotide-binding universal stress UspA family protein n=1 Tax=Amycolatopsis magusensis TaxID=882444 RepID=A0ABS4PW89_9PSEU|nr:universal stress protein [Amycolatopsis magusensis]MBP2183675.1 nucleotide-binding universal stress UspA family protein [Amycolatopsis magusensis]
MSVNSAVVVGVDESATSMNAVRWAAAVAAQRNRELRLVHVIDDILLSLPRPLPTQENLHEVVLARGHRLLAKAREAAREVAPEVKLHVELARGRAMDVLRGESETAGLLVLGTPGLRPLGRFLVGSVTIALSAHAACPVAVVRAHVGEDAPPAEGAVVVGVDGSPSSEQAIEVAFEEASWRGAPLVAVHSWDEPFIAAIFEEARLLLDRPLVEAHEREVLSQRLAGWREKFPEVHVDPVVARGSASERLLEYADRAQLLVVGSRGRGGLSGMLLGSTSQTVLSYALCPVIVARPAAGGKS